MLNETIQVGAFRLNSRLAMPPMATEKSDGGAVSGALIGYYDEMTRGGQLGLVVLEHCFVSPEGKVTPNQVSIADDTCIEPLARLAETIRRNGVPAIVQISHAGSAAKRAITGREVIGASPVPNPCPLSLRMGEAELPREMTSGDIDRTAGAFVSAALRAKKAGFDGVEIHSAHGYFLNQFYSPLTNRRTDVYNGASIEGRTRLHCRIIREVRRACGAGFLISLRWGVCDYMQGGSELSEAPAAAERFAESGADLISVSGGLCGFDRPGHPEEGYFAQLAETVKKAVSVPVLLTGGITEKETAERLLAEGRADMIGVGRAFLKNHRLPEEWMK